VLATGIHERAQETSLEEALGTQELSPVRFRAKLRSVEAAEVIDLSVNRDRGTLMPMDSSRAGRSSDPREASSVTH
jgi:hypothetical protein